MKGHKKGHLQEIFLGQNHYSVPCHLLVANLLFRSVSVVMRTVKSGHSFHLAAFSWSWGHLSLAVVTEER